MSRQWTLLIMLAGAALAMGAKPAPIFVWNASASVPLGLYRIQPSGRLGVTDLVAIQAAEPLATFLADRGYLPRNVPMLKRVLALPGQTVCRRESLITVDGVAMGSARARDSRNRPLPIWQGCRIVALDELFLMNWDSPDSLDGRYLGPLKDSAIIGRAVPIWTFAEEWPNETRPIREARAE